MGVRLPHRRDLCCLNAVVEQANEFTFDLPHSIGWFAADWLGCLCFLFSCSAQPGAVCPSGSLHLIPSLLSTLLSAEAAPLFYINGNFLGSFQRR